MKAGKRETGVLLTSEPSSLEYAGDRYGLRPRLTSEPEPTQHNSLDRLQIRK